MALTGRGHLYGVGRGRRTEQQEQNAAETLPADQMIMEVKFTEFLPRTVKSILPPRAAELTAASKYVLCCDAAPRLFPTDRTEGIQWNRH